MSVIYTLSILYRISDDVKFLPLWRQNVSEMSRMLSISERIWRVHRIQDFSIFPGLFRNGKSRKIVSIRVDDSKERQIAHGTWKFEFSTHGSF